MKLKRPRRSISVGRLYVLYLVWFVAHNVLAAGSAMWVFLVLAGYVALYLNGPLPRPRVRIKSDRERVTIIWDRSRPPAVRGTDLAAPPSVPPAEASAFPSWTAARPACRHLKAQPVELSTGEVVAWVCPECPADLPAGFLRPVPDDERLERVPRAVTDAADRLGRAYTIARLSAEGQLPEIYKVTYRWPDE